MANWFQRTLGAIQREYERRIRRASEVTEYGATHHQHTTDDRVEEHADEDEAVEIVNVPRGTNVATSRNNHSNQTGE